MSEPPVAPASDRPLMFCCGLVMVLLVVIFWFALAEDRKNVKEEQVRILHIVP